MKTIWSEVFTKEVQLMVTLIIDPSAKKFCSLLTVCFSNVIKLSKMSLIIHNSPKSNNSSKLSDFKFMILDDEKLKSPHLVSM